VMAARQALAPNPWHGWKPEHTVETELVERSHGWSLYAVYLNDGLIGYVGGHPHYGGRNRGGYGYTLGPDRPHSAVSIAAKTSGRRMQAIEALVEAVLDLREYVRAREWVDSQHGDAPEPPDRHDETGGQQ
jgi:hypothetical protein